MSKIQEQASNLRYLAKKHENDKELAAELPKAAATIDTLFDVMSSRPYAKPPEREYDRMTEIINGLRESCGKKIGCLRYGTEIRDSFRMLEIAYEKIKELEKENQTLKRKK